MQYPYLKYHCILCGNHDANTTGLCHGCLDDLPWLSTCLCQQCGLPSNGKVCGQCLNEKPAFDTTKALFQYDFPIDRLLQHYKYGTSLHLADTFAQLWHHHFNSEKPDIDLIIPMPVHKNRLQTRGFNQALEIAKPISNHYQIDLSVKHCERIRHTEPQASLPYAQRIKNMKGAFSAAQPLNGKKIAIIDDVMTTGASLNALASSLKHAGALHVECWVIARTLPTQE